MYANIETKIENNTGVDVDYYEFSVKDITTKKIIGTYKKTMFEILALETNMKIYCDSDSSIAPEIHSGNNDQKLASIDSIRLIHRF